MGYFKHETAVIDSGVHIGEGTKVWHFSHIMSGANLGKDCNLGQNVFVAAGGFPRQLTQARYNLF